MTDATKLLLMHIRAAKLPEPVPEYRFDEKRRWRFDLAWRDERVSVEISGGIWRKGGGAHTGTGHIRDMEKLNEAQLQGWTCLQFLPEQVKDGTAIKMIKRAFE